MRPQLALRFQHRMTSLFLFASAEVRLDGAVLYRRFCTREDERCRASVQEGVEIFAGPLAPGRHRLAVRAEVRGCSWAYGRRICHLRAAASPLRGIAVDAPDPRVTLYIRSYRFTLRSSHGFESRPGRPMGILIRTDERGGITTPLEQRPMVRFLEHELLPHCAGGRSSRGTRR